MAPPPGPAAPTLVIVESPAKARTLRRWLGPGWLVRATGGHLLDLPKGRLGLDPARGYQPDWQPLPGKSRLIHELGRDARAAGAVLLATDPDREGEAIAWHLAEALGAPGGDGRVRRVLLGELTPQAIGEALAAAGPLDRGRFEAQQARRVLDRLVGFRVSPLLWRRVRRGLSAGRVQSAALRLLVERELALRAHRPVTAFRVRVALAVGGRRPVLAEAVDGAGRPRGWPTEAAATAAARGLDAAELTVVAVEASPLGRPPPEPFTTAALLAEAGRRLGLAPRRTMALAQRLYEGVELEGEGLTGLVTYPRTDSSACGAARPGPRRAAHEGIRPTSPGWPPERLAADPAVSRQRDLLRLYRLIWSRWEASRGEPAEARAVVATLAAEGGGVAPVRLVVRGDRGRAGRVARRRSGGAGAGLGGGAPGRAGGGRAGAGRRRPGGALGRAAAGAVHARRRSSRRSTRAGWRAPPPSPRWWTGSRPAATRSGRGGALARRRSASGWWRRSPRRCRASSTSSSPPGWSWSSTRSRRGAPTGARWWPASTARSGGRWRPRRPPARASGARRAAALSELRPADDWSAGGRARPSWAAPATRPAATPRCARRTGPPSEPAARASAKVERPPAP